MDTTNIIIGAIGNGRYTVTAPITKEDHGIYLKIEGADLPPTYEVDFANSDMDGNSVTMIGNSDGVLIPHQFIDTGIDIFAFLYLTGEDFGKTVYKFRIPNKVRPDRTDIQPTPEEQSTIDQLINELNNAVEQTSADVITTGQNAQSAAQSAADAAGSATSASTSASQASASATSAAQSAQQASASASTATAAATSAGASASSAATNAERAEQAAGQSGYMFFYIDENGDLHYQRTDNVDVDFYLNDGDLYVRAGA